MGIFSDMIRGIVAEELKAMAAEPDPKGGEPDPKGGEPDPEKNKETTNDPELRALLRKELRDYMASELNGEAAEGDMPTAEEALCSILGLGEKEKE